MIRAIILAATIAAIITAYLDRPEPARTVEVKYCFQNQYAAQRQVLMMPNGMPVIRDGKLVERWHRYWGKIYDLCSLMDRYENA